MRTTTRAALVGAAVLPLAVITPGLAFAGDAGYDGHAEKAGHSDHDENDHDKGDHHKGDQDGHDRDGHHHKKHKKHDNCCDGARGPAHDGPLGPGGLPRSPLPAPTGAPDVLGPVMSLLHPPAAPTDEPAPVDPSGDLSVQ
ncbi:hypothetical protein GCM10023215_08890 [Pseudonocardia yuanmonensis]|uniref:Uncharacterized protein n=1 Tax=Pseudonocardia yuanmonensis TaxID=1095914 RepID=A0ABP8W250_9PSEU